MRVPSLLTATVVLLLGAAVGPTTAAPAPWEALEKALEPYQPIDTQRVARVALEAALHAVDAHAAILPHDAPEAPAGTNLDLLVRADLWPEQIVRLQIRGLYALPPEGVDVIRRWLVPKPEGLILDLRGANGEDLDTLDAVGGLFFQDGVPLYTLHDGRGTELTTHVARAQAPTPPLPPTVVLVDAETRGASEALAALLRDHVGMMVIGANTHGDSARRQRIPFSEDEDLLVATQWIAPASGLDYDPDGVAPHIPVVAPLAPAMPVVTSAVTTVTNVTTITNLTTGIILTTTTNVVETTNAATGADATPAVPDLAARIGDDYVLRRAVDILLGLQALRQP